MCLSVLRKGFTDHGLRRFADLAGAFSFLVRCDLQGQKMKLSSKSGQFLGAGIVMCILAYAEYRQPINSSVLGGLLNGIRHAFGPHAGLTVILIIAAFCLVMAYTLRDKNPS
jgi:hypothetical protein